MSVAATSYVGTSADELLGGAGELFQLTLVPNLEWWNPADWHSWESQFIRGVTDVYEKLAASGLAFPIGQNPAGPGVHAAVIDVRASASARNATVGQLAYKADQISGDVSVATVKRIPTNARSSSARAADRSGTQARAQREYDQKKPGVPDIFAGARSFLAKVGNIVLLALVVALVVGGAYLLRKSAK